MTQRSQPTSGSQHRIQADGYAATYASVGATLRELTFEGRDLIWSFDADEVRPSMAGALLTPWPGRTADGRYDFAGDTHQLALSDPSRGNAIHGLIAWHSFECVARTEDAVTLRGYVEPQRGYPWRLRVELTSNVGTDGLRQLVTVTNESSTPAPVGIGTHPYLVIDAPKADAVNGWRLTLPADEVMSFDDRMLPAAVVPVQSAADLDFRASREVGTTMLNHAYTALTGTTAQVTDATGRGVEIWWDADVTWLVAYTADYAEGDATRNSLAIEPMTCPPDALNSGTDLRVLAPGESTTLEWGIRAL